MTLEMLVAGIIGLIIYFICVAQREKQGRIDEHGYCYISEKLDDLPKERQEFIYRKKNEEKIKKVRAMFRRQEKYKRNFYWNLLMQTPVFV
jgi:hypothetical protein